ncbi:MAG: hypothetical protein WCP28_15715 [Actinomycetes bacterium]
MQYPGAWILPKLPYVSGVGGFAADFYWSSSQNDANNAWNQNFDNGNQNNDNKDNTNHVRPVRGFHHGT